MIRVFRAVLFEPSPNELATFKLVAKTLQESNFKENGIFMSIIKNSVNKRSVVRYTYFWYVYSMYALAITALMKRLKREEPEQAKYDLQATPLPQENCKH